MDSIVKLKDVKGDIRPFTFKIAERILLDIKDNKHKAWTIAEPKKFKFIDNALTKRPSPKGGRKSNKQGNNTEGE